MEETFRVDTRDNGVYVLPKRPKKGKKPGDFAALQRLVWRALVEASAVLTSTAEGSPELCLRAVHAIATCSGVYSKLMEVSDFEARLRALEARRAG